MMLIRKHWRGELSPLSAFLVGGVLIAPILAAGFRLLMVGLMQLTSSLRVTTSIELAWYGVVAIIIAWAAIGIWRSFAHHPLKVKFAGRALLIVLLLIAALGLPGRFSTANELFQIASGHDPLGPPASMRGSADRITVDGPLSEGAGARFAAILSRYPKASTVILRSIGGRLMEARTIADAIRAAGLRTHAREYCLSACTVVLVAGRERSASYAAEIGFHQATMDGYSESDNRLLAPVMSDALDDAGVAEAFVRKAASTPAASMWYPSHREMLDAGFLNREDVAAQLAEIAAKADAVRGRRLEDGLVFERASADGTEITYAYKSTTADSARQEVVRDVVAASICSDKLLRMLIADGVTVNHHYVDRKGAPLGDVRVEGCPKR